MNVLLLALLLLSVVTAIFGGDSAAAELAMTEGAKEALRFTLEITGPLCLWSAVLELLERCGGADALAALLGPALRRLFPRGMRDGETAAALCENVSANLLGLGNAATPAGIRAARGLAALGEGEELCLFVVVNSASIQLLPTTAAALRASLGAAAPFDILPAVWGSTLLALGAGLLAAALLRRVWP